MPAATHPAPHAGRRPPPPTPPTRRSALTRAGGLLRACHPAPAAAVTLCSAVLAAAVGRGVAGTAVTAGAVAAGQLSVGWCNDRVDLARDRAAGRRDKPLVTGTVRPADVTAAALTALLLCVPLSLACGTAAGLAHMVGVAAAWAYDLWLKKTPGSWIPYALAFGLLPAFVTLGLPGAPWPPPWLTGAAALLGVGAHLANVLPDIDDDLAAGVRGLPQRLGARRAAPLAGLLVFASAVALVAGPPGPVSPYGLSLLALTFALLLATVRAPGRIPFLAVLGVALADVALLLMRGAGVG
ncbi:UbiA family prenyltransferase [Streptomyces sp. NPDC048606]|uniref:UbiA family prenyltransferase n=1 Tax=Streptomyces sp. NPDC048606 TaxID=3154726 RepID=UPI00343BFF38